MLVFSKKKYDDAKLIIKCRVLCLLDELMVFILRYNWQMAQGLGCFLELGPIGFLEIKPNVFDHDRECLQFTTTSLVKLKFSS